MIEYIANELKINGFVPNINENEINVGTVNITVEDESIILTNEMLYTDYYSIDEVEHVIQHCITLLHNS